MSYKNLNTTARHLAENVRRTHAYKKFNILRLKRDFVDINYTEIHAKTFHKP